MAIEFLIDEQGEQKHLLIESRISDSDKVLEIAQSIPGIEDAELVREDRLHLSWYHIGKPNKLRRKIVSKIGLDDQIYDGLMEEFLTKSRDLCNEMESVDLEIIGVELFDPAWVVLLDHQSKGLLEQRKLIHEEFVAFLTRCGIRNYRQFMSDSDNLKFQLPETYNPHISFARPQVKRQPVLESSVGGSIASGRPRIRNVSFS